MWLECRFLDTEVDGSNPASLCIVDLICVYYNNGHQHEELLDRIELKWVWD